MQALDLDTEHACLNTICDPAYMGMAIIHAITTLNTLWKTHDIWSIRHALDKSSKNICCNCGLYSSKYSIILLSLYAWTGQDRREATSFLRFCVSIEAYVDCLRAVLLFKLLYMSYSEGIHSIIMVSWNAWYIVHVILKALLKLLGSLIRDT